MHILKNRSFQFAMQHNRITSHPLTDYETFYFLTFSLVLDTITKRIFS